MNFWDSWLPGSPEHIVGNNRKTYIMVHRGEESRAQVGTSIESWGPVPTSQSSLAIYQGAGYTRALFISFTSVKGKFHFFCRLMVPSAFWKLNSEALTYSDYLMGFAGVHFIIKARAVCP